MIEFRNETDEAYNVVVCESISGQIYVHLVGDEDEYHGDEATEVQGKDYEIVTVNRGKL